MVGLDFECASFPKIHFGVGKFDLLPEKISQYGKSVLLVTGARSFSRSEHDLFLTKALQEKGVSIHRESFEKEPTPTFIDSIAHKYAEIKIDVVVGIGGGSAVDAGKAISAMLREAGSVMDYLEGFETKKHSGNKVPFIAVPTSSGTGSEATKNAVLSQVGPNGFKRSIRHDHFVPDMVIVDPRLHLSCPPDVTAASGLDAFTQLLESYVSTAANPITDALALSGIDHFHRGFLRAYDQGDTDLEARGYMAYASLISGMTLASAGLGTVHGFASPIGGFFDIPHGVICGTLLGETVKWSVEKLKEQGDSFYLSKYEQVARILGGEQADFVESYISDLLERTHVKRLGEFGVKEWDLEKIIKGTTNKNNPADLNPDEWWKILKNRL